MTDTSRLIIVSPWPWDSQACNGRTVLSRNIHSIEPTDTVLLYLPAKQVAIEQSISLLALLKRKQQPLLLLSDTERQELIEPILRTLGAQVLNRFFTDTPKQTIRELAGIFLQSGLLDLV